MEKVRKLELKAFYERCKYTKTKISSAALQSVLVVSIIVLTITTALLVITLKVSETFKKNQRKISLNRNALSGLNILYESDEAIENGRIVDLYGNESDSVRLKKRNWGIYEILISHAYKGEDSVKKIVLSGIDLTPKDRYALYLQDQDRPLSLSGNTRIVGDAYLPAAGIRKAYIEGFAFTSEKTVDGRINDSNRTLPELNERILASIKEILVDSLDIRLNIHNLTSEPMDSIMIAFDEPTLYLTANDSLLLHNITLKGNIIVVSKKPIAIEKSASLDNIQIYAPFIKIDDGFQGNLQVFASDSIRIGRETVLRYPSVVGLVLDSDKSRTYESSPTIHIESNSRINGVIFCSPSQEKGPEPSIVIDKFSTLYGQLYAAGLLQQNGEVIGSSTVKNFILQTPSTLYENFLLNAVFDVSGLSQYYLGSKLFNEEGNSKLLKWL